VNYLRSLDSAHRRLLDTKDGIRGQVVRHEVGPTQLPAAELAETVWQACLRAPHALPLAAHGQSPLTPASGAFVFSPQFGGCLLHSHAGGGTTELPDGEPIGKLGFLNRLFGEHLTPSLLLDHVLGLIATAAPFGGTSRSASLLYASAAPGVADGKTLSAAMHSLTQLNANLAPDLQVDPLRVALLPARLAAMPVVFELAHHLFKVVPSSFRRLPGLAVYDYASTPQRDFDKVLAIYRAKAEARGRPQEVGPFSQRNDSR
jgi:hypothetical protein